MEQTQTSQEPAAPMIRVDVFPDGAYIHMQEPVPSNKFIGTLAYRVREPSCLPQLLSALQQLLDVQNRSVVAVSGADAQRVLAEAQRKRA